MATVGAAGLVVVIVVATSGASASGDEQSASAASTSAAAAPAVQDGCQEDLVREAIDTSVALEFEYEITYLKCAEGFGWALIDPTPENFDTATALLRVTATEVELLDLGTSLCPADHDIPTDVAAQIAPPGHNPAGDCPTPVGPAPVPGAATIIGVGPGGGSGEVLLIWEAVPNATGYRVLRSDTADGQFEVAAEFDITTGTATAAEDVVNVFSEEHSYVPPRGTLDAPDQSSQFSYVDVGADERCFRVIAFNAAGDGPASAVGCGAPPGVELEPATPVAAEPTFTG
jgi:hypothetical protein